MSMDTHALFTLGFPAPIVFFINSLIKSLVKCYELRATYSGAKSKIGVRGAIYRYAQEHVAHYSLERSKSIYYPDNSNDLEVCLLFRAYIDAGKFGAFLGHWYLNNPISVKFGDVSVNEVQKVVYVAESDLHPVLLEHYNADGSDSPVQSLEKLHAAVPPPESSASAFSLSNPVAKLQSIERPDLFNTLRPERAHIKSVKDYKEADTEHDKQLQQDSNNLLALSSDVHHYFDGRNTTDGYLESIPLIAIKPAEYGRFRNETCPEYPLLKRQRLEVVVECRNREVGKIVKNRLKTGTESLSPTQYKTHIHVEDASITCACLDFKYKQTMEIWKAHDEN